MKHWALDENGKLRKELYTLSPSELDEQQASFAVTPEQQWSAEWRNQHFPKAVLALESGDVIYIKPEYSVAAKFGGRMTFISFGGSMNAFFCRTEDKGGGWIGPEMLVDQNDPMLRNATQQLKGRKAE